MRYPFHENAADAQGNAISDAYVFIYLTGTTTAAKVYDSSGNLKTSAPQLTTNDRGYFWFEVDNADYTAEQLFDIKITKTGYDDLKISEIAIIGISQITAGKIIKADASGLPAGGTNTDAEVADAVTKKHAQNTDQYLDYGGANQVAVADAADAVTKKHTQGTDTTLGTQAQDLDMGTHKIVNVVDPTLDQDAATKKYVDTSGGSISGSGTAGKITKWTDVSVIGDATNTDAEVADAVTKKHTQNSDTKLQDGAATPIDSVVVNTGGIVDLPKQSRVKAYLSTNQTIATATFTKVTLDAEAFDNQNEFDPTTNYRFTAKKVGYYTVVGSLYWNTPASGIRHYTQIYKNGVNCIQWEHIGNGVARETGAVAGVISLAVGDYLEFFAKQASGSGEDVVAGEKYTSMSIHKLS